MGSKPILSHSFNYEGMAMHTRPCRRNVYHALCSTAINVVYEVEWLRWACYREACTVVESDRNCLLLSRTVAGSVGFSSVESGLGCCSTVGELGLG